MTVIDPCVVRRMEFQEVCVRLGPGGGEARTPTSRRELSLLELSAGGLAGPPGGGPRPGGQVGCCVCHLSSCPDAEDGGSLGRSTWCFCFHGRYRRELTGTPGKWQDRVLKNGAVREGGASQ